jgi:hypothetical protein
LKLALLASLRAARAAGRPVVLLTRLSDGHQCLWPVEALPGTLAEAAQSTLDSDSTANLDMAGEAWFLQPHNPPLRMMIGRPRPISVGAFGRAEACAVRSAARAALTASAGRPSASPFCSSSRSRRSWLGEGDTFAA